MTTQFNASDKTNGTLSNVNTTFTSTGSAAGVRAVDPQMSGKYYVEFTKNTNSNGGDAVGIASAAAPASAFNSGKDGAWTQWIGNTWVNGANQTSLGLFWSSCDMAVDLDNSLIWFRTDGGNWNGSGTANPATGVGGWDISAFCKAGVFPAIGIVNSGGVYTANFGNTTFSRSAPVGFIAWPTLIAGVKIDPPACKTNSALTVSSIALSGISTSQANALLYLVVNCSGGSRTVSSVADTAGLTWTRRKQQLYASGANALEIWTAPATSQLSGDTITITLSGAVTSGVQASSAAFATASNILLDPDSSLPDSTSGSSTTASVTGFDTGGEDLVLGIIAAGGGGFSGAPTAPAGWANIQSGYGGVSSGITVSFIGQYKPSAVSAGSLSETIPSSTPWAGVVDAVLVSNALLLSASFADDTGLAATIFVDWAANFSDADGLSATLDPVPDLFTATFTDDDGFTAVLGSGGSDLAANFADDNGVTATLDVRDAGDLLARITDDVGLSAAFTHAFPPSPPVQVVVFCIC